MPPEATMQAKPSHTDGFVVREYDQWGNDPSTRMPLDGDLDEDRLEEAGVRGEMEQLQKELNQMKQGPFAADSDFMRSLPEAERAELLKALAAEDDESQAELKNIFDSMDEGLQQAVGQSEDESPDFSKLLSSLSEEEADDLLRELQNPGSLDDDGLLSDDAINIDDNFDESLEGLDEEPVLSDDATDDALGEQVPLMVTLRVPQNHKVYVKAFNGALSQAQNDPRKPSYHVDLWKAYLRCKQNIPTFLSFIDADVWDFLWKSLAEYLPRPQNVVALAKDMLENDIDFDISQTIDYINALQVTNDAATALKVWEDARAQVRVKSKEAARFWQTGINVYAAADRPKKAQNIAIAAFEKNLIDVQGWLPVFEAWTKSDKPSAPHSLWACYLRLKERYAERATREGLPSQQLPLELLGEISSALLQKGRRDMSLAVFKDMVVSKTTQPFDSLQIYAKAMSDLKSDKADVNETSITEIGLTALTAFPDRYKNKFFFGSWIKWLIGEGKADEAGLVVELMQEYGIRADARHLNGIIGAWLRGGTHDAKQRAEQMAWAMIHTRVEQVASRTDHIREDNSLFDEKHPYSDRSRIPDFLQRNIPPATIETFSILLQRYTRSPSGAPVAEHITNIMVGPAAIKPNSFILNHWMYMSLRTSDISGIWKRFDSTRKDIKPDLETFAVLWSACRRYLDLRSVRDEVDFPAPRVLAKEMNTWFSSLTEQRKNEATEGFTEDLYEQIVRSFCLSQDLHGLYHILNILRDDFGFEPHDDVLRMALLSIARQVPGQAVQESSSTVRQAGVKRMRAAYRSALWKLGEVLQGLVDVETAMAAQGGATQEEVEKEGPVLQGVRGRALRVFVLMVLLRVKRGEGFGGEVDVRGVDLMPELVEAAGEMGLVVDGEVLRGALEGVEEYEREAPKM
jgi:hypothetical protein